MHPGSGIIKEGQLINVHPAICDPKGWRNAKIIGILSLAANIDLSGGNCFVLLKLAENNFTALSFGPDATTRPPLQDNQAAGDVLPYVYPVQTNIPVSHHQICVCVIYHIYDKLNALTRAFMKEKYPFTLLSHSSVLTSVHQKGPA